MEEKNDGEPGDDEDEWEDASDEDDVGEESDSEQESRGGEKRDKNKESPPTSAKQHLQKKSAAGPKEQRTPRPRVQIPPPVAPLEAADRGKPLSPIFLEAHKPVRDWGEEMEMQSPRSSMGEGSPLKPSSTESSPPQKKNQVEEESPAGGSSGPREPQEEQTGGEAIDVSSPSVNLQETVTISEPETVTSEPPATPPPTDPVPSEDSDPATRTEVDGAAAPADQAPCAAPREGTTTAVLYGPDPTERILNVFLRSSGLKPLSDPVLSCFLSDAIACMDRL